MLINRANLKLHGIPFVLALIVAGPMLGWYVAASWFAGAWLGGGSLPALVLGSTAGLIIAWEMMLWPRKLLRRLRLLPSKYWLSCHLWFGIACLPLAVFHSGFHWGGWFSTSLLLLLIATVLSGVYGALVQNVLPKWMLRQLPAETITSEIEYVSKQAVEDADQLLVAACGPRETVMTMQYSDLEIDRFREAFGDDTSVGMTRAIVIGAPREAGRIRGRSMETQTVTRQKEDARALWNAYDEVRPFMLDGATKAQIFGDVSRAEGWFRLLRHACSKDAERVIGPLESWVDQRRQFTLQRRMHGWLQSWLPIHVAISVGLCVLLVAHIFLGLRYW